MGEMEGGASDETLYPTNFELSCAVCSPIVRVYPCETLAGDNHITDDNKCGKNGGDGASCAFTCAPGFKVVGKARYVCDGSTGKWKNPFGGLVCKANIKCREYTCKAGFKKESAANTMGADDETCCSVVENVVYTRWGARDCPEGTTKLYEGFMAGKSHSSWGGGYNYLCMHNKPQYPNGFSNGNQNGNLLYGTEYERTGVLVKNVNG